ncbi:MAG: CotH kinase family protein [Flavobacteriales bacterium]|nr:CotH kinase family protein [Flavobacteriales bacterium]
MRRTERGNGLVWWLLLGGVAVSLIVFTVLLGPGRAVRIAAASFLSTTVDGLAEDPGPHQLRILELRIDPSYLDSLERDLPWSGGENMPATLVENGVEYPVEFRYRGIYSASHYLGGKKSFRLKLPKKNPFAPYRKLNVIDPKSFNMANNHLGNWIAARMGVPTPWNELVYVRINGKDQGVMELYEQPDGKFERIRGLAEHDVPVYKGDFPPIEGRELPAKRMLWRNATFWEYESKADSTVSNARLRALVDVVDDPSLTITQRRDTLAQLIEVDAYARYFAAMLVVNTKHIDQYHNQWLVMSDRTGRFYPIFWDALLMFPPEGEPLYFINDALAHWFLRIPEWRRLRDRYAYEAMRDLHASGVFMREFDRTIAEIRPSVLRDRNKYGHVSLVPSDVHRFSVAHVISSFAGMRTTVNGYWDRLSDRLAANAVTVERTGGLHITCTSEAPLELRWRATSTEAPIVTSGMDTLSVGRVGEKWTVILYHDVSIAPGTWDRPFANWQHYEVAPIDRTVVFPNGTPPDLIVTNAITDEAIE